MSRNISNSPVVIHHWKNITPITVTEMLKRIFTDLRVTFLLPADLKKTFQKLISGIALERQTVWIQIRLNHGFVQPDSVANCLQKSYQQIRLAPVLKTIFINVPYHILVASLTLMALS